MKELELVEGIIVGKTLYYINSTNAKLFESTHFVPDLKDKSSDKVFIICSLHNNYLAIMCRIKMVSAMI